MSEHQDPAVPSSAETPSAQEDTVICTQPIDTPTERARESSPKTPPLAQSTTGAAEEVLQDQDDPLQIDVCVLLSFLERDYELRPSRTPLLLAIQHMALLSHPRASL
jgi:hypothetical protein